MKCPNCGQGNSADAKFCSECGASLKITCPVCGTVAEAGAKFCNNCGASLQGDLEPSAPEEDLTRYLPEELLTKMRSARAGHAMQGERRTVTMLFADVTGSTAAAEKFDPEDWVEIMNGAFEHLIAPIYRYEGTLAQLRGDAILAFFGAPIAHEDDPVRALRAGLEMLEAIETYSDEVESQWGIPLQIRVGINTGLVVVGEVGSDLRVEYTALGDAINVAARMEQTAQPGTVQVSDATLNRTGDVFETIELGPVEVKGKSEPVISHQVIRYAGAVDSHDQRPIVGRDDELAQLDDLLDAVLGGSGLIASVIAEAGIGKTRLLQEWRARSQDRLKLATGFDDDGDVTWLSESSRSYDSRDPFATIRNLLRRYWGSTNSQPEYESVFEALSAAGIDDPDSVALLAYLAGAALSPEAEAFLSALETPILNAKAGEALLAYLEALAGNRPLVLLLEDVHWADDVSLALLEQTMDLTERAAVGVVASLRPYREEPAWRIHEIAERNHHHRYHQIALSALGSGDGGALLDSLMASRSLREDEKATILKRSDGNPFFIEEIAKSLAEADGGSSLPSSLSGTLTARLDRLDEPSKYLIQLASVLGTEFDLSTLDVVVGRESSRPQVTELLRRGILVEAPDKPGALRFRHALFQQAAYETILKRTRRELHQKVAHYLIDAHRDRPQAISAHLVEAGELTEAFPFLTEAATNAWRSMSLAEAIRLLSLALDNIPESAEPEAVEKAHVALGEAYSLVPDLSRTSAAYQELYDYGESQDRPSARVSALNRLGWTTATLAADLEGAMNYLEDARVLAEESGDDLGLAEYHMNACFVVSLAGDVGTAVAHDEKTVELGEKSGVNLVRITGMVRRAVNYTSLLDFDKAMPAIEQGLHETKAAGLEEAHTVVEGFGVGVERLLRGDLATAKEVMTRADRTLERFASFYRASNLLNLAATQAELGDVEGALGRFVETLRVAEGLQQPFIGAAAASGAAALYADVGLLEPVDALRSEAKNAFDGPMADFLASSIWADLGFASLATGDVDVAVEEFESGLAAHSTTQYVEAPRLFIGKALASLQLGDVESASAALAEAKALVDDKNLVIYKAVVGYADGLIAFAISDFDAADAELAIAQQTAMDIGQRLRAARILEARAEVAEAAGKGEPATKFHNAMAETLQTIAAETVDEKLRQALLSGVGEPASDR